MRATLAQTGRRALFVVVALVGAGAILGAGLLSWAAIRATRHPLTDGD